VRGDLDDYIGSRHVEGCVSNLRDQNGIKIIRVLKVVNDAHTLGLPHVSGNVWPFQPLRIHFEGRDVIGKYNDLVTPGLVKVHEVLASHELVGIVHVEGPAHVVLVRGLQIFSVEVRCHFTPDLNALDPSQVSLLLKVKPVSLIELRSNEKVDVANFIVLTD
jgi:hypothetical protein